MKELVIYNKIAKVSTKHVGTWSKPNPSSDEFGELSPGQVRGILVDTKFGQLSLPNQYGNKKIIIKIIEG